MLKSYPQVHITKTSLVNSLIALIDEYADGTATESEVISLLGQWSENNPTFLFEAIKEDGKITGVKQGVLSKRVVRLIGIRRTNVVQTFLTNMQKQ